MRKLFMSALVMLFVLVTTSGPGFGEKVTVTLLPGGDAPVGTAYPTLNAMGATTLSAGIGWGYAGWQTTRSYLKFYLDSIPAMPPSCQRRLVYSAGPLPSTPPLPIPISISIMYPRPGRNGPSPGITSPVSISYWLGLAIPNGTFNVRENWDLLANHSWDYAADLQGGKVLSVLLEGRRRDSINNNTGLFESKEDPIPDWRPYLRIEYEVPDPPRHTVPLGLS